MFEGQPWWVTRKDLSEVVSQVWGQRVGPQGGNWVAFELIGADGDCHLVSAFPKWFFARLDVLLPAASTLKGFGCGLTVMGRFILGGFRICLGLYRLLCGFYFFFFRAILFF